MIIRRRTYSRKKEYSYGYFMLNLHYSSSSAAETTLEQNIYTSCMQEEAPVGYFPKSYRETDKDTDNRQRAIGCNDGNTIVVWTIKRCFRSTNGGVTWTLLGTFNAGGGQWLGNIVCYMDTSAYYMSGCYRENGYRYLLVYKYTISTGAITKHIIKSIATSTKWTSCTSSSTSSFANWNVETGSTYQNRVTSPNMISNNGQYTFWEFGDSYGYCQASYLCYGIVDMPHLTYSAPWFIPTDLYYYAVHGLLGSYIKDSSTYGYMILISVDSYSNRVEYNGRTAYNLIFKKIVNAPVTYNGKSMTISDITSTIKSRFNSLILKVMNKRSSGFIGALSWLFCTNNISYNNLIVIALTCLDSLIFTCNNNYTNIVEMGWRSDSSGYSTSDSTVASHCITPDNKYYVNMTSLNNIVYNLSSKTFKESYKFRELEPTLTSDLYNGLNIGYMLPKTTFWS